ncbi:MAG: COX15/CtaA family protein [Candidatus Sumerlaeaceae bacterium]
MTRPAHAILSGQTQRIASVTPNPWVARLSQLTVAATFLLLIAGALVTGNKAALADPTWPKFVGEWYPKYWKGGLLFEDSHRLVAGTVAVLTLALAGLLQIREPRPSVRKLGWSAFALVIAQALIGGLIIHSIRHPLVSMFHGMVAQAFFCMVLALAVFTSGRWIHGATASRIHRAENPGYLKLCMVATSLAYAQVVLGTGVRHTEMVFMPYLIAHICVGTALFCVCLWFTMRTYQVYRDVAMLRRPAMFVSCFLVVQILLGIASIYANRARLEPEMAHPYDVAVSTAHLASGAIILAILFVTSLRARRLLATGPTGDSGGQSLGLPAVDAAV